MAQGSILVTGANGTLGSHIAGCLASDPATATAYFGLYAVRNVETATTLRAVLAKAAATTHQQHPHDTVAVDLGSLAAVRAAAAAINARVAAGEVPPLRAIIWNAAFQEQTTQTFSGDGLDLTFQTNFLAQWLLTLLLLPSFDKTHGRIVVVGSFTHDAAHPMNKTAGIDYHSADKWKSLFWNTDALARGTYSASKDDPSPVAGMRRYGASKLCDIMMIKEFQERLDRDPDLAGISVLGVDPGGMATTIQRHSSSWAAHPLALRFVLPFLAFVLGRLQANPVLRSPARSARDLLRAALETAPPPLSAHPKGLYFDGTAPQTPGAEARDATKTRTLWHDSVRLTGLQAGDTILKDWE